MLKTRPLGTDGPQVSELCLGTMMFGDQTDESEAGRILDLFLDAGGNFIDTADTYAAGDSERILGRLLAGRTATVIVASKVGNPVGGMGGGLSPAWISRALRDSLDRLGRDSLDLYYLHRDDEDTSLESIIAALGQELADGRIRAWGFSNFRGWKIAEMIRIADNLGIARPVAGQPYYHALYRAMEVDYIPACRHFGIGVVPYSPLARGVLTGKYADGVPEGSRASRHDRRITQTEMRPELIEAARGFARHVAASGRQSADVALRWVLENAAVSSVLVGPRTAAQMQAYLAGPDTRYDDADEEAMDRIVPTGTVVGAYTDPAYPVRGRFRATTPKA